jgi:hypothetical protein
MKSKLLISTAALLAGVALASAQEMKGGGPSGSSAQSPAQHTSPAQSSSAQGSPGQRDQDRSGIAVGTAVPPTVHVAEVPEVIVDIHPEWRSYYYFVMGDEIIIVDRNHRIVAVIAV